MYAAENARTDRTTHFDSYFLLHCYHELEGGEVASESIILPSSPS